MKRLFITTILTENLIAKYNLSFAACNFSFNLLSGNAFDKVYSILPLYTIGDIDASAFDDSRFKLIYCRFLRLLGRKFTILAAFVEQYRIFKQIPKRSSVWIYNLNSLNAFLVVLLKLLKKSVQVNVIVLDFTPVKSGIGLNSLYLRLINSAHGNICLADSELFTCANKLLIPGVVPSKVEVYPQIEKVNNKFLLSGALSETIAQISMVLETFAQLPNCELHITGGDSHELIEEYARKYSNIIFHGKVSFSEYLMIMHETTFVLSTRDPFAPENQCNFPSKIIEAFLHNRIVVSTIKYPQLKGIEYFFVSSIPDLLKNQISDIIGKSEILLIQFANQGKKISEMFSAKVWNEAMLKIENS